MEDSHSDAYESDVSSNVVDSQAESYTSEGTPSDKGKKKASDVWNYFVKKKEVKKAQCKICSKELAYHGGTTNLRAHLEKIHPVQYSDDHSSKSKTGQQGSMERFFSKKFCSATRSKEITEKIVNMIITDTRPLRIVECPGFRELIHSLEPGYSIPSRKSVKAIIYRRHSLGIEKLKSMLSNIGSVSLTTDIWTSDANDAYITITIHFIALWEMKSFVLATREFPGRHTGTAISEAMLKVCEEFGIKNKVATIVHDEAANMQLSLRILGDSSDDRFESISCNAHRLQLCLKKGLSIDAIDRMIRCASKLVGHFKHSALATNALTKRQEQMQVDKKSLFSTAQLGGILYCICFSD